MAGEELIRPRGIHQVAALRGGPAVVSGDMQRHRTGAEGGLEGGRVDGERRLAPRVDQHGDDLRGVRVQLVGVEQVGMVDLGGAPGAAACFPSQAAAFHKGATEVFERQQTMNAHHSIRRIS